jgi:hypothetical protein
MPYHFSSIQELANSEDPETRENCAVALYNMSSHKVSRREMLQRGGVDVLIRLSKTARTAETKQVTAVTLHALSSDGGHNAIFYSNNSNI